MLKNQFHLRKLRALLKKVNGYRKTMAGLSDQDLQAKTQEFRDRLKQGQDLDSLLPEAYAVVREVAKRVLGLFPYDVQVLGAIALHQGQVAEMATGEGKTLTATMPLYLNALTGKGVILVTTNSYLALRDAKEMGPIYRFLGLSIACAVNDDQDKELTPERKRAIYQSDIVYTTNSGLGFDYLIENLADSKDKQYLPFFNYVIIDEIDSVLLDSAQTPMIISGAPRVQSNYYGMMAMLVATLVEDLDYKYNQEKQLVWLTSKGCQAAEAFLGLDNLYASGNQDIVRHLNLALRAHKLYKRDKDYVVRQGVKDQEVVLLDRSTGRLMELTRLQGGQHQAIEAKENVKLTQETRAMASITYQNLFKLFQKIAGMTGTGKVAEREFKETYSMSVIKIPSNRKPIRRDLADNLYKTLPEKVFASLSYIKHYHSKGNPLLIFTGSVEMSEIYSALLLREGLAHNLLNANNAAREAQIIAESGQLGAVTVATSMAGRGTDIKLGPGVAELGGLVVIGTERMENQRIDLQIRGRAGRQGDPGLSKFFVSLEDDLLKKWGPDWVRKSYESYSIDSQPSNPQPLKKKSYRRLVAKAQRASESAAKQARKLTLDYAQSLNIQRQLVYKKRKELLEQELSLDQEVEQVLEEVLKEAAYNQTYQSQAQLYRYILENISFHAQGLPRLDLQSPEAILSLLMDLVQEELAFKRQRLGSERLYQEFQRLALLKAIDENWIEQVDYLQQLRQALASQYFSQKNPLLDYYQEAYQGFLLMQEKIKQQAVKNLLMSELEVSPKGKLLMHFP
ncbi:accessory Sec system translocase SecA2 [Streptococcus oricebi]|uniref:Protein translocase subunit SecA n=1 Tax=Streptococcus oricebi TaxID=1547447 RepID=A0ABS5B2H7_9STRE|nr:accessory Sec system translocase SecA2 [Streptococcus oricebi]MBP2622970.1 accessory Sec system translocase SecA2 [Streptococcus oricebi]